ncbi:MAG TPA: hypothetical protein PLF13_07260 [candidate division Zixibacteria bacterium]|nr:hypothetical protein [candidate division Zixibacteria bacterium]
MAKTGRCSSRFGFGLWLLTAVIILSVAQISWSRDSINLKTGLPNQRIGSAPLSTSTPYVDYTAHNRGNIQLAIANNGTFGTLGAGIADPFTGDPIPSCIYPRNSNLVFLYVAAIWIGAVVGHDTLVSVGDEDFYVTREFWADEIPLDAPSNSNFAYYSIDPYSSFYSESARSEEDIYCSYTDTITDPKVVNSDPFTNTPHQPLGIRIEQTSMAWSYDYSDDFILFDYQVENIGSKTLNDVYMGIWVDGDAWHTSRSSSDGWDDDIVGFYHTHPAPEGYGLVDTVNIAYHADNDGDPVGEAWDYRSIPHVVGIRVVRTPSDSLQYSFNWWITNYTSSAADFGPRRTGTDEDPFRPFSSCLGTPEGDRNKYYIMRHQEFDYDQLFTALDHSQDGWLRPPDNAATFAAGYDCRYLLSFGPFTIHPGQKLPISFAWVGGEDFHTHPGDFANLFDPYNPSLFYGTLDFSHLAANARWASWVYDNPGVDTDGDGDSGKAWIICADTLTTEVDTIINGEDTTITLYTLENCDTIWYEGDAVPDFCGAGPPPPPEFWVYPEEGKLRIRFNGLKSETTRDIFSREVDFEGYRIYLGRDEREQSFTMISSYDRENYNKLVYQDGSYVLEDSPFLLEELRCLYADSCEDESWYPLDYTRTRPYQHPDFPESTFIFEAQDYNVSTLGGERSIRKIYETAEEPNILNPETADSSLLTEDGYFKYYEYEFEIEDLQPSVEYYVNVTAFDYGSPKSGLQSLESSVSYGAKRVYAQPTPDEVAARRLEPYVYPNPYRIDDDYSGRGFENRESDLAEERARLLHFANLPARCTISIFSLDGDLVRKLEHDVPADDPTASHETWNLITRNTQAVVSGLYYYVVEAEDFSYIGKVVILK